MGARSYRRSVQQKLVSFWSLLFRNWRKGDDEANFNGQHDFLPQLQVLFSDQSAWNVCEEIRKHQGLVIHRFEALYSPLFMDIIQGR